ncbi:hypothetical protein OIO90_005474 [Microbotryomycetes sp. JL221]|nr:hypothetical protein OIO90_005474 [Microbotryomycetes sp. JL221]
MFRTGHDRRKVNETGNVAVYQINSSDNAIMKRLDVPMFSWSRLITGETNYTDVQHLHPESQAVYLWGNMVLYYLRKAVVSQTEACML